MVKDSLEKRKARKAREEQQRNSGSSNKNGTSREQIYVANVKREPEEQDINDHVHPPNNDAETGEAKASENEDTPLVNYATVVKIEPQDQETGDHQLPPINDTGDDNASEIDDDELTMNEQELFDLINLNPRNPMASKKLFKSREAAVVELAKCHPSIFKRKYKLEGYFAEIDGYFEDMNEKSLRLYPLTAICALGASLSTIKIVHGIQPDATFDALCECGPSLFPFEIVEFLVESDPYALRQIDDFYATVFHHVAKSDNVPIQTIQYLVEKGNKQLSYTDHNGCTPLHLAIENNSPLNYLMLLVDKDGDAFQKKNSFDGQTPLHQACCSKETTLEVIQFLAQGYPQALKWEDGRGNIPLHDASRHLSSQSVQFLVSKNKETLTANGNGVGWTPLHMVSAETGRADIVQFLAKKNASMLMALDNKGRTPLHVACRLSDIETVGVLTALNPECLHKSDKEDHTPFVEACLAENSPVMEFLAKKFPPVLNTRIGDDGWSPLHLLCTSGKVHAIQVLLHLYPDGAKEVDGKGRTPLALFASHDGQDLEMIQVLLHAYPDARKIADHDGNLPLNETQKDALLDLLSGQMPVKRIRTK